MKTLKLNLQSIENEVEISDGYHTFDELYDHRITLYIALCRSINFRNEVFKSQGTVMTGEYAVWRSKKHSDGYMFDNQFILGIGKEKGKQMTYHLPYDRWDEVSFAQTLDIAPEFDGHTSQDVLERIKNL